MNYIGSDQFCYTISKFVFDVRPRDIRHITEKFKFDFRTFIRLNDFNFISPLALESSLCHCGILCIVFVLLCDFSILNFENIFL